MAYEGMPVMLLSNLATNFGLYNGAITKFHGLLYLPDDFTVKLKESDFNKLCLKNLVVQKPLDIAFSGYSARMYQVPKGAVLLRINDHPVLSYMDVNKWIAMEQPLQCVLAYLKPRRHYLILSWFKVKLIRQGVE